MEQAVETDGSAGKLKTGGMHCIAPGCSNFYYKNKSVAYHRFPTNGSRLKKWMQVLKRKEFPAMEYARVCSDHFLDSDYAWKGTFVGGIFQKMKSKELLPTAFPSKIDFSGYNPKYTDCPTDNCTTDTARASRLKRRKELKVFMHISF